MVEPENGCLNRLKTVGSQKKSEAEPTKFVKKVPDRGGKAARLGMKFGGKLEVPVVKGLRLAARLGCQCPFK